MAVVVCQFCDDPARSFFDAVPFCKWHLILFYLSANLVWQAS